MEALEASQENKGVQQLTADPASGSAQAYQQMDLADSASGKSQAYEEMSAQDLRELANRNPGIPNTKLVGDKYVHMKKNELVAALRAFDAKRMPSRWQAPRRNWTRRTYGKLVRSTK